MKGKEEFNYNLSISIKAICNYENLTGKPFSNCFNDPNSILPLIYCVLYSHPENKIHNTYQEMLPLLANEKILEPIAIGIKKEIDILSQFEAARDTSISETNNISEDVSTASSEEPSVFLKDIIPVLVSDCGLDINYIMNEMSYTDIDSYMKYRELKKEDEMETQRFWTYLTMLPHVGKKLKKPEDLIKFPWETQKKKDRFDKEIDQVKKKLKELGILKDEKEEDSSSKNHNK